ncbi:MAG: hypothetical protein AAGI34_05680 [Pseudomonadota bacterium]
MAGLDAPLIIMFASAVTAAIVGGGAGLALSIWWRSETPLGEEGGTLAVENLHRRLDRAEQGSKARIDEIETCLAELQERAQEIAALLRSLADNHTALDGAVEARIAGVTSAQEQRVEALSQTLADILSTLQQNDNHFDRLSAFEQRVQALEAARLDRPTTAVEQTPAEQSINIASLPERVIPVMNRFGNS